MPSQLTVRKDDQSLSRAAAFLSKRSLEQSGAKLSDSDPRRMLLEQVRGGQIGQGAKALPDQFLALLKSCCSDMSIHDLPADVAQMILDARAETMTEFFRSWSESIKKNAEADKETAGKAELERQDIKQIARSRSFLARSLAQAVLRGKVKSSTRWQLLELPAARANYRTPAAIRAAPVPIAALNPANALAPPSGGIQLRRKPIE